MKPLSLASSQRRRRALGLAAVLVAAPLAACSTVDRTVPTSAIPDDYHARHPVVLANAPTFLDVFPVGPDGRLDVRTLRQLEAFAQTYRQSAQSNVLIRAPSGPVNPVGIERTIDAVRSALVRFGVRGPIDVGRYPVTDPRLASPLHIGFTTLQARIESRCGDWPDDLNSGATLHGWENRSYYNLGCASTKTLTAQIDDPRDLLGPRAEDPSDVQLRTRAIGLLRGTPSALSGQDPGTVWKGAALTPITTAIGE